ncbi:protein Spindly-like [Peromyscus leucopus]|uniref:protein Spindly-like n=1 Tax=Peromyscus leucopus TaxID=10041 RepID=UPI00188528A8|nr:protein Spindly-like [Peromyscus leucopus]
MRVLAGTIFKKNPGSLAVVQLNEQNYNQEKYALQREVELRSRMLESLSCECETVKQQQKTQLEQLEMQLNRSHRREVSGLKNKNP